MKVGCIGLCGLPSSYTIHNNTLPEYKSASIDLIWLASILALTANSEHLYRAPSSQAYPFPLFLHLLRTYFTLFYVIWFRIFLNPSIVVYIFWNCYGDHFQNWKKISRSVFTVLKLKWKNILSHCMLYKKRYLDNFILNSYLFN